MTKSERIAYAAVGEINNEFYISILVSNKLNTNKIMTEKGNEIQSIISWFKNCARDKNIKFNAVGLPALENREKLATELWLTLDIVPHLINVKAVKNIEDIKKLCWKVTEHYDKDHRVRVKMGPGRRVIPSYLTELKEYSKYYPKDDFEKAIRLADHFKSRNMHMVFINATAAGGGVAHMRHAMMRFYRLLGVDVSWHVLKPNVQAFNITKKKFHNVLQGVAPSDCCLTELEKNLYVEWIEKNAELLKNTVIHSDVFVIDDPQPAGLIPHIKKINPKARIFYRSHIQIRADLIDKRKTQQFKTWQFLWQFIKLADVFISHPIPDFVPKTVKKKKLVYMPPSTDPLDGLNKKLSRQDLDYYLLKFQNYLIGSGQKPLDLKCPYLIQIARFDPSKGIFDVIESYRKICGLLFKENIKPKKIPQLVIAGNGSIDDPEGVSIYEETRQILELDTYSRIADKIKIARLPHHDQLLNALLDKSLFAFQLSRKEGFEFKVTEALMKGKPVIAYKTGGIPLQIKHGQTGFLLKAGNTSRVADYAMKLILYNDYYKKISKQAAANINQDYLTLNNCAKWLKLAIKY